MTWVANVLERLGVTGREHETTFPDGAAFRIEIPSVEGPKVLEAVKNRQRVTSSEFREALARGGWVR